MPGVCEHIFNISHSTSGWIPQLTIGAGDTGQIWDWSSVPSADQPSPYGIAPSLFNMSENCLYWAHSWGSFIENKKKIHWFLYFY